MCAVARVWFCGFVLGIVFCYCFVLAVFVSGGGCWLCVVALSLVGSVLVVGGCSLLCRCVVNSVVF